MGRAVSIRPTSRPAAAGRQKCAGAAGWGRQLSALPAGQAGRQGRCRTRTRRPHCPPTWVGVDLLHILSVAHEQAVAAQHALQCSGGQGAAAAAAGQQVAQRWSSAEELLLLLRLLVQAWQMGGPLHACVRAVGNSAAHGWQAQAAQRGRGPPTHLQGLAAGAAGALAQRLLAALVAGEAVDLVVDAVAGGVIAVLKQSPAQHSTAQRSSTSWSGICRQRHRNQPASEDRVLHSTAQHSTAQRTITWAAGLLLVLLWWR